MFTPQVIGPHEVPEILDAVDAEMNPELDDDRSRLYLDLVINSVSEAVREVLANTMLPFKYEYQSDFAKHYVAEGLAQGRVAIVTRLLAARFGSLSDEVREKIAASSVEELDAIGDRLLTAASLREALAPRR